MRPIRLALACLLIAACATTQRSKIAPEVSVSADREPFFGSNYEAPIDLGISVTNRSAEPIRVRSIRLRSPGGSQWTIRALEKIFNETIAPGQTKSLLMPAIAIGEPGLVPTEPVTLRVDLEFEAHGDRFREVYNFNRLSFD